MLAGRRKRSTTQQIAVLTTCTLSTDFLYYPSADVIVQAAIWSTVYARWLTKITLTGTAILGLVYVKWIMRQVRISACFKNLMRFMHDGH
uniref:Uncharacterized protein n=1 Tax=Acrobeloides nanus TaxID=290746 RepID=A0A914E520_9BILA